jgi:hypothetical protein
MFAEKLRTLVAAYQRMLPDLNVDIDAELEKYKGYAEQVRPFVVETISYLNGAVKAGKTVLVEGANAAMLDIDFGNSKFTFFFFLDTCNLKVLFPRNLSLCYLIKLQCRRCLHGAWSTSVTYWRCIRCSESLHNTRRRWSFPHGTIKRNKEYFYVHSVFSLE